MTQHTSGGATYCNKLVSEQERNVWGRSMGSHLSFPVFILLSRCEAFLTELWQLGTNATRMLGFSAS
jgi:hypothetical protein